MTTLACPDGRARSPRAVPPPIRAIFVAAGLEPPRHVDELEVHAEVRGGVRKTLLRLTTPAVDLDAFVAGLPRSDDAWPGRTPRPADTPAAAARPPDRRGAARRGEREREGDDDAPWWHARAGASTERTTFDAPDHDFVEVIVCASTGEVLLRSIRDDGG